MPAMQPCLQPADFLLMSQAVHLASRPTANLAAVQRRVVGADAEIIGDDPAFTGILEPKSGSRGWTPTIGNPEHISTPSDGPTSCAFEPAA